MYKAFNCITEDEYKFENLKEFLEIVSEDEEIIKEINWMYITVAVTLKDLFTSRDLPQIAEEYMPFFNSIDYGFLFREARDQSYWDKYKELCIEKEVKRIEKLLPELKSVICNYSYDWIITKIEEENN